MEQYKLKKSLWTDGDFDIMGWHDATIHAITWTESELIFDIDYIFMRVGPVEDGYYRFWIAPCTLVFENVWDADIDLGDLFASDLEVLDINRENPQRPRNADFIGRDTEYDWMINTSVGEIRFKSVGYKQFVRALPILSQSPGLKNEERGGVSFDRISAGPE